MTDPGIEHAIWYLRVKRLIEHRGMTPRAARIVVDAAMYGIGCTEGRIRKEIERKKSIDKTA